MLAAKQSGTAASVSLAALTEQFSVDARIERKLVSNINNIIYTNDLLAGMKPGDAYHRLHERLHERPGLGSDALRRCRREARGRVLPGDSMP